MFKVKLDQIWRSDVVAVLNRICNSKLSFKVSWRIMQVIKRIEKARADSQELRMKIVERYVEKDEKGKFKEENGQYIMPDDKKELFEKEIKELFDVEIEINTHKISMQDLIDNDFSITVHELKLIEDFIEMNHEED